MSSNFEKLHKIINEAYAGNFSCISLGSKKSPSTIQPVAKLNRPFSKMFQFMSGYTQIKQIFRKHESVTMLFYGSRDIISIKNIFFKMNIMYTLLYVSTYNVCFKKTWTNYSSVSLLILCFVQVFLKQMLYKVYPF